MQEQALTAAQLIEYLGLRRHPEGGWFRETYRSDDLVPADTFPGRFAGPRPCSTSIYFLLERGDVSALHRIRSDELWHFHAGTGLTIHSFGEDGAHAAHRLGTDIAAGESFQAVMPAGLWFGAEVSGPGDYVLVGCTVSPGFDFAEFEMGGREALYELYPAHHAIIERLTC